MKNKWEHLPAKILTVFLILSLVVAVSIQISLHGTPWQKYFCRKAAEEYLTLHFAESDFQIDSVVYNFKTGDYVANISSPSSVDSTFNIYYDPNSKETRDSYESSVSSGWNTWLRLNEEYRKACKSVIESMDSSFVNDIGGGDLMMMEDIPLPLDYPFDLESMGREYGSVTFYAQDEVTMENACEILLQVRTAFDEANVPFKNIDFVLQPPKEEWANYPNYDRPTIHTEDFLYEDIYAEGLRERVQKAHDELSAYYAEQDKLKQAEIEAAYAEQNKA